MTIPTPPPDTGDKTRKLLIAVLVLLVVLVLVLANPEPLQTDLGEETPSGVLRYALVHLDDGSVPELLLNYGSSLVSAEMSAIVVYGVDDDGRKIQFPNAYYDGVTSTGGEVRSLQRATRQPGMFSFSGSVRAEEHVNLLATRQGNELVEQPAEPEVGEFEQLTWTPDDLGAIEAIADGGAAQGSDSDGAGADGADGGPNPTPGQRAPGERPGSGSSSEESRNAASGEQTVTGTVKIFRNRAEIVAYQEILDPNPSTPDNRRFAILVLDEPTDVTAKVVGGNERETRTVEHVVINPDRHDDGEKVTITFSADDTYWPSDTGIPFGLAVEDGAKG